MSWPSRPTAGTAVYSSRLPLPHPRPYLRTLPPPCRRPEATALVQQMQHGELRPGEVQDLLSKARAELKAAEAAGNGA